MPERTRKADTTRRSARRNTSETRAEGRAARPRVSSGEARQTTPRRRSSAAERVGQERRQKFAQGLEQGSEQGRAARPVDMLALREFLAAFNFPVPKEDLLAQARERNVDERAIAVLNGLAVAHFYSAAEVTQAVGRAA